MVNFEILKNPIVIGILAATITYLYMWYDEKRRRDKNPKARHRSVNVLTPGVVGIITWFVASSYFNNSIQSIQGGQNVLGMGMQNIQNIQGTQVNKVNQGAQVPTLMGGKYKHHLVTSKGSINSEGSLGSASYHIIGKKNIRLPPTDVFIDLARF